MERNESFNPRLSGQGTGLRRGQMGSLFGLVCIRLQKGGFAVKQVGTLSQRNDLLRNSVQQTKSLATVSRPY